ncbi:MAG: hypothetical protein JXA82_00045 [Sedimentisphaerales bacterium]|nr:hypothetical protein [Sedimentisphaerales bacterium]
MISLLDYLIKRPILPGQDVISYDEISKWPEDEIRELEAQGYLCRIDEADGVNCNECENACYIPVEIRKDPKSGKLIGTYFCEDEDHCGPIEIDLIRLQQWKINKDKLSPQKIVKKKESLEVRVARELRRDPNIDSIRIGKLLEVDDGVVRGTTAWKNRKQLRVDRPKHAAPYIKTDSSGGFSNNGERRDIEPTINEPREHHHDINGIITDFQLGKRKKYPTPEEIAKKMSSESEPVSIDQAKQWLKETESIFGYEYEK